MEQAFLVKEQVSLAILRASSGFFISIPSFVCVIKVAQVTALPNAGLRERIGLMGTLICGSVGGVCWDIAARER